jgi:hypothetical protein
MKNPRWILILILLASLTLGLVACGGEPETAEPAATEAAQAQPTQAEPTQAEPATDTPVPPTETPVPTAVPEPTTAPETQPEGSTEGLDLSALEPASDLSSYRANMAVSISGTNNGEPVEESLNFLIEYTSEPPAQHIIMSGMGMTVTQGMDNIEMYQVGDMSYLKMGDQWLSMPATADTLDSTGFIKPEDVLEDTCGWTRQNDTEYNGVMSHHWTASKEDMEACMTAAQLADIGNITSASGELYVAVEGNYVVHMSLVFEGQDLDAGMGLGDEALDQGRMEVTFDMSDVNQPFVIELPEEAVSSSGVPDDLPIPDDAQDVANAFGMITFNSPSSPADVSAFYQDQMPQNGWTEASVDDMGGMFMLEYNKDGRTASLMISPDEDTGMTSVLITIQEE